MRPAARAYGPHRDEDMPRVLTVMVGRLEVEIPFSDALARQRRHLNNAAWFAGLGGDQEDR